MHAFKSLAALAAIAAPVMAQSKFSYGTPNPNYPGVVGANSNGPTNPSAPKLGTAINQTSVARLASVNSIDDWCTFGPPDQQPIANVEGETVAYCTKARNNARVIPDGTLTAVHFVKTPLYVQVMALGDFTKINLVPGDEGGELDPHGATNMGNPVGGNVTSNVSGKDVFYEEWMNFVSADMICMRVCIAGTDIAPTPLECLHTLDEMGCNFVMPGNYADNSFDTCDGDAAYPPGLYPQADGQTSTFQQYFSSVYTDPSGGQQTFVNASPDQTTPSAAFSLPSTSNCSPISSISNGITEIIAAASTTSSSAAESTGATSAAGMTTASRSSTSSRSTTATSTGSGTPGSAAGLVPSSAFATMFALGGALFAAAAIL